VGFILSLDTAQDPGARAVYDALATFLENPAQHQKETEVLLSRMRLPEAFGVLSSVRALSADDRLAFFKQSPADITETIGLNGAQEITRQLLNDPQASDQLQKIRTLLAEKQNEVDRQLRALLKNDDALLATAITTLGQVGKPDAAPSLVSYLGHSNTSVRNAGVVALQRLGKPGVSELRKTYQAKPTTRSLIVASVAHAIVEEAADLLTTGWRDADAAVRLRALSVFGNLPPVLENKREQLLKEAKKELQNDPDLSVRFNLLLL